MTETVTIPPRFNGPPESGNGGYVCGVTALLLGDGPAETTLRVPPPLDGPLTAHRTGDGVELRDGDAVVAESVPAAVDLELPAPVTPDEAARAVVAFDIEGYRSRHAFPTCFTCGPDRAPGDGLRIFPGMPDGGRARVMWPWVPASSLAAADGLVAPEIVWAALDCPSGFAVMEPGTVHVLGRLAVAIDRRPNPGEDLVVAGWPIGREGRKGYGASAIWDAEGRLVARGRATWIRIDT